MRVAGDVVGDGGAAGGVSGSGAFGDVDGEGHRVSHLMDRATLVMAVVSGQWQC